MKKTVLMALAISIIVTLLASCASSNALVTSTTSAEDIISVEIPDMNTAGGGTTETETPASEVASASEEPVSNLDGEETTETGKPVIDVGWEKMNEEERASFQAEIFNAIKEADTETLSPYVVEYTIDSMKAMKEKPEMFALYQRLMSRVTYEDGFISGPSIKYLLGSWWIEHSHDAQWAYLSEYATELFEHIEECPVVTYRWNMEDSLWGEQYKQQMIDISAVLHPLGIDPNAFCTDPATALAAESLVVASGQDILDEVIIRDARKMEGYFQANISDMLEYIEENQTDYAMYPTLISILTGIDVLAVSDWAKDNVIVVYDGTNVYYYIPFGSTYNYWELVTLPSLTTPGRAIHNDISIVECIIQAYDMAASAD